MIRPKSRFLEHLPPLAIPEFTFTPAQSGPIHNLDNVSDSESYDSYSETSDLNDMISKLKGIIELISKTTEEGLAITVEGYPFYHMLVECSRAIDMKSGADAAMRTVVRRGFLFARGNMIARRKCMVDGKNLWYLGQKKAVPPKKAPNVTHEQRQDVSDRQSKEGSLIPYEPELDITKQKSKELVPHITYEQKPDGSDPQSKEDSIISYEPELDITYLQPKEVVPQITYKQKQDISKLVNDLPEREMEIAYNIVRKGMPHLTHVVDHELEVDIDKLPNEILHSLLRFVRMCAPRAGGALPARRASVADCAGEVEPVLMSTRRNSA